MVKKKKIGYILVCAVLALVLSLQSFAFDLRFEEYKNYFLITWIEDDLNSARENTSISPEIDELLELYAEISLYDLDRDQAILAMLRKFIQDYDAAPLLADSLLTAFDSFGGYYSQTTVRQIFSGAFRGYGFMFDGINFIDGHYYNVTIRKVLPDSPASRGGFKAGDEFLEVNGINVEGMGIAALYDLLISVENKADFVIRRGESKINISLEKDTVFTTSLTFETPFEKTALITLENFTDIYVVYDFYNTMLYLEEQEYENLIIDLRDNSGGDLIFMANILNLLVTEKDVVLCSIKERNGELESLKSSGDGFAFEKIVVLVNRNTASASEIFALSLSEITGAVIIGSQTAGKGIGQFYIELENGDVAAITAFEIISNKGVSYHARGITPDIIINPAYKTIEREKLEQLNFVNCMSIREGADNKAVLALNQRLVRIGYISPDDVTSKLTDKTIAAVEIFQRYHKLGVGISNIDYRFIDILNHRVVREPGMYQDGDAVLDCAVEYILKDKKAAEDFAAAIKD